MANPRVSAILTREWRLFKPLSWMFCAAMLLLAGTAMLGASKPKTKEPAPVVLHAQEQVSVGDVRVTPLESAALPDGCKFIKGFRIELPEGKQFSHPVTLNFGEGTLFVRTPEAWQETRPETTSPGEYVLARRLREP